MDTNTVKNITIATLLLGLGTACFVYFYRDKLKKFFFQQKDKGIKQKEKDTTNAMKEVGRAFLLYADNFQGLFETMYKAAHGNISQERTKNVLLEWDIRMDNISQCPVCLKSWWATIIADIDTLPDQLIQERAQGVMDMIETSGIIRDNRSELTASEDTSLYYQDDEGKGWSVGQKLRVESPVWYLPCTPVRIIEKGYCEII